MSVLRKTSAGFFKTVLRITVYIVLLIILFYAGKTAYTYGQELFSDKGMAEAPGTDVTIDIAAGTSMKSLGGILEEYGIVKDSRIFYVQSFIYEVSEIAPGTYTFNTSQSAETILNIVRNGPNGDGTEEEEQ